jgi:hypothetical protein
MLRSTVFAVALSAAVTLPVAPVAGAATEAATNQTSFGNYIVTVAPDPESTLSGAEYQITVRNDELLLSRLSAPYTGSLSKSFVADLNHDGAFEVVVTYTEAATHATAIKVYSWKDNLLQPIKLAELDVQQKQGYRGDDEVAVVNGKLIRLFQIYEEHDGEWVATASQRKLHYSFDSSRWMVD